MDSSLRDEIDCGNFLDQIDDLIEFPPENECDDSNLVDCNNFSSKSNDTLPESNPLSACNDDSAVDLSAELAVPYEDILQLEWLSSFMEDSFSSMGEDNLCLNKEPEVHKQFQTSSPVSVLESSSSSSCSVTKNALLSPHRARSKRPRPATFNPDSHIQLVAPRPFQTDKLESESPQNKPKPKPKPLIQKQSAQAIRKCLHCEITKTPQWRSGPMGPKTLCNACGVRYKSGRLFPEYRPAASPTFIPTLHSNSHKKVAEMRSKIGLDIAVTIPKLKFNPSKTKDEH